MARRGTLWGSLGEINSRDQELKEGLSADGVLYFAAPDDATLLPDFYSTGLGFQPWPMVPAGCGTYVALSPDVLIGTSWAAPAVVAQGQDAGAPMPKGAEGPAMTIQAVPNDARYTDGSLWGMYGDASSPANQYGSQAAEAWAQGHTGSMANVIGVIDTGIDYTHPDLYLNIWLNQREIPVTLRVSLSDIDSDGLITFWDLNGAANATYVLDYNSNGRIDAGDLLNDTRWENGVDEDGNGYRDDLIGWDFVDNNNDPMDGDGHGTHVAGTIGAMGENGIGVVGVNWNVQLVALQIFSANGDFAGDVAAINYFTAAAINARAAGSTENFIATNNSWGGGWYEQPLLDAIVAAAQQDILFVGAAGNESSNNDEWPSYPNGYSTAPTTGYEAVIAVAAITSTGSLSEFSNFGANSVDIAAPGSDIWSLLPSGEYRSASGTSMAAPHVTGAIALYASLFPHATGAQIREALLTSTTFTASLNNLVASDGRLNIPAMLATAPPVTEFADWLDGSNNADNLSGLGGNDTLKAGDGADTLVGGLGRDSLIGGEGNDVVSYAAATGAVTVNLASNLVTGAADSDTLSGIENVLGGPDSDSLLGNAGSNQLLGGEGSDTLGGGLGADSLIGGNGDDFVSFAGATGAVTVSLGSGRVSGASGNDTLSGFENILGGDGADSLLGDSAANRLIGGNGADTLDGSGGIDLVSYDGAIGAVTVNLLANRASGALGNDSLFAIENAFGGNFADSLLGDNGTNFLAGGAGSDTLDGGLGADSLVGNAGLDFVSYSSATGAVTVSLASALVSGASGSDSLSGIENVLGGNGADSLLGDPTSNELIGGASNDTLEGGLGADSLFGGTGNDLVSYAGATGAVTVELAGNRVTGAAGSDSLSDIEHVLGGNYADRLFGAGYGDLLDGGAGADTLDGGAGHDTLVGGDGADRLIGGARVSEIYFVASQQNPLSYVYVGWGSAPVFSDLDNDGDQDIVVGRSSPGVTCFRRNTDGSFTPMDGVAGNPSNPFQGITVGGYSAPAFTDLDLNGTLDLVIGSNSGTLAAFRRNANGYYTAMDGVGGNPANPFNGINVGGYSKPSFADLDLDGDDDLIIGSSDGTLAAYQRNADGSFSAMNGIGGNQANPFAAIDIGANSAPTFNDMNGDSLLDLVVGSDAGALSVYFRALSPGNSDRLVGGNGADTLEGVDGADTLDGGAGNDCMIGGAGNDLYVISDTLDVIIETSGGGADTIITPFSMSMPEHIEALRIAADVTGITINGGVGNDMLIGNGLGNSLNGGAGDDVILVGNVTLADIYALFAT